MPDQDNNLSRDELPASVAAVTAVWLHQVLQPRFPHIEINKVASERIGEGYGLASEIFCFNWESDRMPHSVVAKLWSTAGPAGAREVGFYHTFVKGLTAWIPDCYYAAIDPENDRGVLILEHLGRITQGDCLLQLSLPLANAVARCLAGIHAAWFEHEALSLASWLPSLSTWERGPDWYAPRRASFLERFNDRLDRRMRNLLDRSEHAQAVANERLARAPVTLLHGDLHLDNFVFVEDTVPVLLDWARCAKGPTVLDLYELLFSMSNATDREQVYAAYSAAFEAYTGKALDRAEVWHQLGAAFLRNFALATFGIANWQPASPREAAMIDTGLKRTIEALSYWSRQDPALLHFLI